MRLAVVSPFVDRQHGTERSVAELIERLARDYHFEIHLYAQYVEDLNLVPSEGLHSGSDGGIIWHRVPSLPGPHVVQFLSWLLINRLCRIGDGLFRRLTFDLVLSPGVNCLDADVIVVHAVFHRLVELQEESEARGLRALHRNLYYRVLRGLERRLYGSPHVHLASVSPHTSRQLLKYFGRGDVVIAPPGVDMNGFSPEKRKQRRGAAREVWNFSEDAQVLLMIGNDWRNKGLPVLLQAAGLCSDLPLRLLIVGQEDPAKFEKQVSSLGLSNRVTFAPPSADVLEFFAAADVYVAPSLEDSFNLPVLEAMACGLPVIVSVCAGVSDWIHDEVDGLLLRNPTDAAELAMTLRKLLQNADSMQRLGNAAAQTAATFTWDQHAARIHELLVKSGKRKP